MSPDTAASVARILAEAHDKPPRWQDRTSKCLLTYASVDQRRELLEFLGAVLVVLLGDLHLAALLGGQPPIGQESEAFG